MITAKAQYAGLKSAFGRYWAGYGRWRAVWTSPIFHLSLLVNLICYRMWVDHSWVSLTLSLLPSILGFSLGTYALVFSLLTSRIKVALKALITDSGVSFLDELNSLFMHFLVCQTIAIVFAIIYPSSIIFDAIVLIGGDRHFAQEVISYLAPIGGAIGCLLLVYALFSVATAALVVYRLAAVVEPD